MGWHVPDCAAKAIETEVVASRPAIWHEPMAGRATVSMAWLHMLLEWRVTLAAQVDVGVPQLHVPQFTSAGSSAPTAMLLPLQVGASTPAEARARPASALHQSYETVALSSFVLHVVFSS